MKQVQTRVGPLAYAEQGSGLPLVLLHSAGHDHHDFDAILPSLAERHRVIALDWPGFGESPAPQPPASLSASLVGEVLEDAVAALGLERAVFLGNSVGGMAAARLAARQPQRVRGLVLVSSGGFTPMNAVTRAFCRVQGREWVRRHTGRWFARAYLRRRNSHTAAILQRFDATHARPATLAAHAALWRSFAEDASSVIEQARGIRCPTLLAWGRHDPVSRRGVEGRCAREAIAGARYVEFDTGHMPFAEDPPAFLRELLPFLEGLPA
ncbi:alpha/beta hydrolase [Solimonas fluminis]|uniref:Alpha/beta hydrolase n=1 Tax=Solimonas fluminis TaxID=2086571 RepID=A0A2S5TFK9_9GAMM|nr:alpha/beta fold hydrolase [Solimonas fluminis]PPE73618.1 alpha/beta hydrolase [Solimonas fluminis]